MGWTYTDNSNVARQLLDDQSFVINTNRYDFRAGCRKRDAQRRVAWILDGDDCLIAYDKRSRQQVEGLLRPNSAATPRANVLASSSVLHGVARPSGNVSPLVRWKTKLGMWSRWSRYNHLRPSPFLKNLPPNSFGCGVRQRSVLAWRCYR